jgi:hypothetical protein
MPVTDLRHGKFTHMGIRFQQVGGVTGTDLATGGGTSEIQIAAFSDTHAIGGEDLPAIEDARDAITDPGCPFNIFIRDGMPIEELAHETRSDHILFTAKYNAIIPEVGKYTVSIDTGGGTFTQTQAYKTLKFGRTPAGASKPLDPPDFKNSIDVQDGVINGAERIIPALRINVRAKIHRDFITSPFAYSLLVARMTGRVNQAAFGGAAPGELLFAGASGEVVSTDPMLSFAFIYSPNVTGLTIGDIKNISKKGHEHLWFNYRSYTDPTSKLSIQIPNAAYSSQIYEPGDFGTMKIGFLPS